MWLRIILAMVTIGSGLWLAIGCGGGVTAPSPGTTPTPGPGDALRAYKVTDATAQGLGDPQAWDATITPTRLVLSLAAGQKGYSAGRFRDSAFNAHGNYASFDQSVDLRAAYTSTHIYIYASWLDHASVADVARDRWYIGAGTLAGSHYREPDVYAATQRLIAGDQFARHLDEDSLMLMFPIGDPDDVHDGPVTAPDGSQTANEAGALDRPFSQVGCQAACHAGPMRMAPAAGRVDVWNWRAGTSNPLGIAHDESGGGGPANGRTADGGATVVALNGDDAPAVEYDPTSGPQTVSHPVTGAQLTLDPLAALLTGHTRAFAGTATRAPDEDGDEELPEEPEPPIVPAGRDLYEDSDIGFGCASCHGARGVSGSGGASPMAGFARVDATSRDFRAILSARFSAPSDAHYASDRVLLPEGSTSLTTAEISDLAAYIAALPPSEPDPQDGIIDTGAGIAGVVLTPPTGNAADIAVLNASGAGGLDGVWNQTTARYTIVLRRRLDTGHATDDVTFSGQRGEEVPFGLAITDADRRNHAGTALLTLEFAG